MNNEDALTNPQQKKLIMKAKGTTTDRPRSTRHTVCTSKNAVNQTRLSKCSISAKYLKNKIRYCYWFNYLICEKEWIEPITVLLPSRSRSARVSAYEMIDGLVSTTDPMCGINIADYLLYQIVSRPGIQK